MLKRLAPAHPIPLDILQHALRSDLPLIVLAAIILAAGLASITLWALKSRDPLLLWLGIFAALYGLRLFISNDLVRVATGTDSSILRLASTFITYIAPIPCVLFFRELLGSGWRNSIMVWFWVQVVFAPIAICAAVFAGYQPLASTSNNLLVVAGSILVLVHLFLLDGVKSQAVILKFGFLFFLACVLLTNLGFRAASPALEPLGFLGLVCALGYAAALRAISREQQLIEVEQELATARRIQSSILPKSVPNMCGLDIATRYVPMTAVAGDFYDFLPIDEHCMTILVADVSGHGVPAALIASMLKVGVAAQGQNARDPAAILAGLNGMLQGVLDGQFVTAACAFIDLDSHAVTYAGAGHPPALLVRSGGTVVELAENGLFLGPFPKAAYTNMTVPFGRGDTLLLYTDGIIEATLAGKQPFGDEGLRAFMTEHYAEESSVFAERLIRAASGPVQEDDLTVVVTTAR